MSIFKINFILPGGNLLGRLEILKIRTVKITVKIIDTNIIQLLQFF